MEGEESSSPAIIKIHCKLLFDLWAARRSRTLNIPLSLSLSLFYTASFPHILRCPSSPVSRGEQKAPSSSSLHFLYGQGVGFLRPGRAMIAAMVVPSIY